MQTIMELAIVLSNTLLLGGPREEEAHIYQELELVDESVTSLLAPWKG